MMIRRLLSVIPTVAILGFVCANAFGQISNLSVRIATANITSGPNQCYEQAGRDILKALKPDIVAIQEFKAAALPAGTNDTNMRALVDECFGTNFHYFKQTKSGFTIPNGVVSRWPIIDSGSWDDTAVPTITDRSFAWAQIDLPGTNDLYVVSVHLYASGSPTDRNDEAVVIKSNILANFPANSWIIVGGDFNTGSRGEPAIATFTSFLSDYPIPSDQAGDRDTNAGRSGSGGNPYDYVLPSFSLTNFLTSFVMPSHSFSNGLVFDTRVYTPTNDFLPAVATNSAANNMQHMAVVKQLLLPVYGTNVATPPSIVTQPQTWTNIVGTSANFFVAASGTAPLAYQWQLNGTNLASATATNYSIASVQLTNAGDYTCIVTNAAGSITSSVAALTVISNIAPTITTDPVSQTNYVGTPVNFFVAASGTAPLSYQWRFNDTNIAGATGTNYSIASVQTTNAGGFTCIVTNTAGNATSAVATLTVVVSNVAPSISTQPAGQTNVAGTTINFSVIAAGTGPLSYQWRFNGTNVSATATNSTYSIASAQTNHSGPYTVVITNVAGAITSTVAQLSITSAPPVLATTNIVISQFYGGGGFAATCYKNDFVELFNPNATTVSLAGWAVQYASATGTSWQQVNLAGTIAPYSYYLVMLSSNAASTVGIALPTADITNANVNIGATAGKLALTTNGTALSGSNPVGGITIADFVGYGTSASAYEGLGPVVTQSGNTNSLARKNGGFTDSNSNTNDFEILIPPLPRNSASPANPPPSGTPASAPTLATPQIIGNQLVFQLTGTTSSNYVVQASTNLTTTNWFPLQTNAAPFWFTNAIGQPQQFFRGTVAP